MRKIFRLTMILAALIAASSTTAKAVNAEPEKTNNPEVEFYNKLADDLDVVKVYDTDELTNEMLENRDGEIIVEKTIGIVLNDEGDGEILNTSDDYYNYINYSRVENAKEGDIILTYCIYNPDTNYIDDILLRFDYIIDETEENYLE